MESPTLASLGTMAMHGQDMSNATKYEESKDSKKDKRCKPSQRKSGSVLKFKRKSSKMTMLNDENQITGMLRTGGIGKLIR